MYLNNRIQFILNYISNILHIEINFKILDILLYCLYRQQNQVKMLAKIK